LPLQLRAGERSGAWLIRCTRWLSIALAFSLCRCWRLAACHVRSTVPADGRPAGSVAPLETAEAVGRPTGGRSRRQAIATPEDVAADGGTAVAVIAPFRLRIVLARRRPCNGRQRRTRVAFWARPSWPVRPWVPRPGDAVPISTYSP